MKSCLSRSHDTARPAIRPQNAAPMFSTARSATVTRKQTSAPRVKRSLKEAKNAACSTRSIAKPPSAMMNAFGAASMSPVKAGAIRPKATARRPVNIAAV